jgi:hypothetical protein
MARETRCDSIKNGCNWTLKILVPGVAAYSFGKNHNRQENLQEQCSNALTAGINTFIVFPLAGACSAIALNATDPFSIVVLAGVALTSGIIFNAELCNSGLKQVPRNPPPAPSRV